jgi:hypothetical protein
MTVTPGYTENRTGPGELQPLRVSAGGGDGTRTHDFFNATEVVTDVWEQDNEHGAVELVDRVEAEWLGSQ